MGPLFLMGSLNVALFYVFSGILIISAFYAVFSKRSVHAVLSLILAFFSAAWIFISLKAEFVAMLLIIIYVGAIAVLFLFVVMMLEEPTSIPKPIKNEKITFILSSIFGILLFIELFIILITSSGLPMSEISSSFSIKDIGRILYTNYFFEFQSIGILFFISMIGAIILTLEEKPKGRHQNMAAQSRREKSSVQLENPPFKSGVKTE